MFHILHKGVILEGQHSNKLLLQIGLKGQSYSYFEDEKCSQYLLIVGGRASKGIRTSSENINKLL